MFIIPRLVFVRHEVTIDGVGLESDKQLVKESREGTIPDQQILPDAGLVAHSEEMEAVAVVPEHGEVRDPVWKVVLGAKGHDDAGGIFDGESVEKAR